MRHLYFLIRFTTQTKGSHRMILDNQFTSKESFLSCRSNSFSVQILTFILRLLFPKSSQQFTSIHRLSPILLMGFQFIKSTVEAFCHIGFLLCLAHLSFLVTVS